MVKNNLPARKNNNLILPAAEPEASPERLEVLPGQNQLWAWERLIGLTIGALAGLAGAAALIWAITLGAAWALGSILGAGLVLLNLLILKKALTGLARHDGRVSLRPYLAGFLGFFGLTVLAVLVIIGGRLGHPLAFLAGLSLLWPALIISAVMRLILAQWAGRHDGRSSRL